MVNLFDFLSSLEHLGKVHFEDVNVVTHEELPVRVPLPPCVKELTFNTPIELLAQVPNSLECVKMPTLEAPLVNLSNNIQLQLDSKGKEISEKLLESLQQSKLASVKLTFRYSKIPSVHSLQSLIEIAGQKGWKELEVQWEPEGIWDESRPRSLSIGVVILEQRNLPSMTRLVWNLPVDTVFHPSDMFHSLEVSSHIRFSSNDSKVEYLFTNLEKVSRCFKDLSSLKQLTRFQIGDTVSESLSSGCALLQTVNLPNVESVSYRCVQNPDACRLLVSIASFPSLKQFTGFDLSEQDLILFLSNLRGTSPVAVALPSLSHRFSSLAMSDHLHRVLVDLKSRNLISLFSSRLVCACESNCWLQEQSPCINLRCF